MSYIEKIKTSNSGTEEFVVAISDIAVTHGDDGIKIYSTSGRDGGIQTRSGDLNLLDETQYKTPAGLGRDAQVTVTTLSGKSALLLTGPAQDGVAGYWLDNKGNITGSFDMKGTGVDAITASEMVAVGDETYLFTASTGKAGLSRWQVGSDGKLTESGQISVGMQSQGNDIFAIEHIQNGNSDYLLAISSKGDSLQSFQLGKDGTIKLADELNMKDGIGINTPTAMTQLTVDGKTFALLGSSGSSSITVMEVGDDGSLKATDHIYDDLNTRFSNITVLESIEIDGRGYVVAGGADDGLSLMTLLPDGRMLHMETIADDNELALNNPTGLALTENDGKIGLYVAGLTDDEIGTSGVNLFEVDPRVTGAFGEIYKGTGSGEKITGTDKADQIFGHGGNDDLIGGKGDDIITDGAGKDDMWGGEGADIFILNDDDEADIIHDFEVGVDRIDMSQMGRFYSLDALGFTSTNTGAELNVNGEVLTLKSHDNKSIKIEDLQISDLLDLQHTSVEMLPEGNQNIKGTNFNDIAIGGVGDDLLMGGGGSDRLDGNEGDDVLMGGSKDVHFDPVASQVYRLYQATLDRSPDEAGHQGWTKLLLNGSISLDQAAGGFVNSKEFQSVYGELDNSDFVTLLYNNVLDRMPDSGGLAAWVSALEDGYSRTQVVTGFSESREFKNNTSDGALEFSKEAYQSGFTDDVFRLYQATLDRAPDLGGLEGWTAALSKGMEINQAAGGFANSKEFKMTYDNLDDEGFVSLLYQNVLGRDADAAGLEGWTNTLKAGASRGDIVVGFSQSGEFVKKTAADVTAWVKEQGTDDVLNGGAGDNILMGGILADEFEFDAKDDGNHKVLDLESWDTLSFVDFGYSSAQEIRDHFKQDGDNAVFNDQGVTVELVDTLLEELEDDEMFRH